MTPDEVAHAAEVAKASWIAGFQAARHWPNHGLPELHVEWRGSTPHILPDWKKRQAGWVG